MQWTGDRDNRLRVVHRSTPAVARNPISLFAEDAVAASDREWNDHEISALEVCDFGANLDDHFRVVFIRSLHRPTGSWAAKGATMADHRGSDQIHLPLEILTDLIYLTKRESEDAQKVVGYMTIAEEQVSKLAAILGLMS